MDQVIWSAPLLKSFHPCLKTRPMIPTNSSTVGTIQAPRSRETQAKVPRCASLCPRINHPPFKKYSRAHVQESSLLDRKAHNIRPYPLPHIPDPFSPHWHLNSWFIFFGILQDIFHLEMLPKIELMMVHDRKRRAWKEHIPPCKDGFVNALIMLLACKFTWYRYFRLQRLVPPRFALLTSSHDFAADTVGSL